jgi:hypothetical protein
MMILAVLLSLTAIVTADTTIAMAATNPPPKAILTHLDGAQEYSKAIYQRAKLGRDNTNVTFMSEDGSQKTVHQCSENATVEGRPVTLIMVLHNDTDNQKWRFWCKISEPSSGDPSERCPPERKIPS